MSMQTSSIKISIVLNKSKGASENNGNLRINLHNGRMMQGEDFAFIRFRLVSEKSEVPMFVVSGNRLKATEQKVSASKFLGSLYGSEEVDAQFGLDISEEAAEAIASADCKAVKISFTLDSIQEAKESEWKGVVTDNYRIINAEVETLVDYYGLGKVIDPNHVAAALEAALLGDAKHSVVTAEDMQKKAEKFSKNKRSKLIKGLKSNLSPELAAQFDEEYSSSSDLERLIAKYQLLQAEVGSEEEFEEIAPQESSLTHEDLLKIFG